MIIARASIYSSIYLVGQLSSSSPFFIATSMGCCDGYAIGGTKTIYKILGWSMLIILLAALLIIAGSWVWNRGRQNGRKLESETALSNASSSSLDHGDDDNCSGRPLRPPLREKATIKKSGSETAELDPASDREENLKRGDFEAFSSEPQI